MKHCIIVKFNPNISMKMENSFINQIKELFDDCLEIEGIHDVKVFRSCTNLDNRADIMIQIDMEKSALEAYDKSDAHLMWKTEYSRFIATKTVFDYDDTKPANPKHSKTQTPQKNQNEDDL